MVNRIGTVPLGLLYHGMRMNKHGECESVADVWRTNQLAAKFGYAYNLPSNDINVPT